MILVIARSQRVRPDDRLRDEAIHLAKESVDCFAEFIIGRAFARPVGSQ